MPGNEPAFFSYLNSDAGILRPVVGAGVLNSTSRTYDGEKFPGVPAIYKEALPTSLEYDGITSYQRTGKGTIELWHKNDGWNMTNTSVSDSAQHYLVNIGGVALASKHAYIIFFPGAGLYCDFSDGSNFPNLTVTGGTWAADTWYHMAFTWDYSLGSNQIKVYQDGVVVGQAGTTLTDHTADLPLAIGQRVDGNGNGYKGWIAGLKIYNYAKTDFTDRFDIRGGMNDTKHI